MTTDDNHSPESAGRFATTHWSIVLAAGRPGVPQARTALAALCETYWYPLYAYVRRQGYQSAEAQDLTQGFFARLLEKGDLRDVRRERGRFRSFLLASLKHYLINEWDRARAEKRGGGRAVLSLDFETAESRYRLEPADQRTAEALFEKQWALLMLDRVRALLRNEYAATGQADQFECLQSYLTGESPSRTYAETARQLGMTEGAVKMAVHRLRRRFRQRLRDEIAETVAGEDDIDDEVRSLTRALQA